MKKTRQPPLVVVAAALIFGVAGCVGDPHVHLRYQPVVNVNAAAGSTVGVDIEDATKSWAIGERRDVFGTHVADVYAKDKDVASWVTEALTAELQRVGLRVARAVLDAAGQKVVVAGRIDQIEVKRGFSYEATVAISVVVTRDGRQVLVRPYRGNAKGLVVVGLDIEYETVLQWALQNLMRELVPDVLKAIA
jgi:hypothetical protein